uniref:Uncharacterized protein n=1 Tax=Odontella aurita TaxID=265563 RepID=A0A7S4K4U9_9STRA|mmetsp:Transcript_61728/g.182316  ORF Transcript_61728/g.182316 Transcript_61728/m.182316 type:complete len:227 (+) Transcript_61728:47-727(+)
MVRILVAVPVVLLGVGPAIGLTFERCDRGVAKTYPHEIETEPIRAEQRPSHDDDDSVRDRPRRIESSSSPSSSARRTDRRRWMVSVAATAFASAPLLSPLSVGRSAAAEEGGAAPSCRPPHELLDARAQLDLAVQASSVQAWSDAADVAGDPLLDGSSLTSFFDSCRGGDDAGDSLERKRLRMDALKAVRRLREELSRTGLTTEEAMAVMKYGTGARVAIDSYFGI